MKLTVIALLCALQCAQVLAMRVEGNTIILTDDEVAQCAAGGGCIVAVRAVLEAEFARQAAAMCRRQQTI